MTTYLPPVVADLDHESGAADMAGFPDGSDDWLGWEDLTPEEDKPDDGGPGAEQRTAVGGWRLTARDRQVLAFLVDHRVATVPLLHRAFWPDARYDSAVLNRLGVLREAGLVEKRKGQHESGHAIYHPTPAAHDLVGADYPRKRVTVGVAALDHSLAVAEVAGHFLRDGWTVVGERRLDVEVGRAAGPTSKARARAKAEGRAVAPVGLWWTRSRGGFGTHTPDLVVVGDGTRLFVEVERNAKTTPGEYEDLVRGYLEARLGGRLNRVIYYTPSLAIAQRIDAAVKAVLAQPGWGGAETGLGMRPTGLHPGDLVEVKRYVPGYATTAEQR